MMFGGLPSAILYSLNPLARLSLTAVTPMLSYLVCATPRSGSTLLCHALEEGGPNPVINYLVRLLTAHDASWDAYFLGLGYEPLKLTYEELADGTEAAVRRVLEHLGIPAPDDLVIRTPRLSVQADEVSERWVARVREHLAALEAPEPA
jgi:LPS sulfotransferase NodH